MSAQILPGGVGRGPRGRAGLPGTNAVPADTAVAAYYADVDSATYAAAAAATDAAVELAVEDHTPGIELAYASRTSNFTTTNTASNNSAGNITSVTVTFTGQGRPVDLRFFCPSVYHAVANTFVSVVLVGNAGITDANNQICAASSPVTTTGPSVQLSRRTAVLTDGVSYTFTARAWSSAAGTATLVGATFCPIELVVTSR